MKKVKLIGCATTLTILFAIGGFFLYATVNDYKPSECEIIHQSASPDIDTTLTFNLLSWNIGYAGLDKEMDFFYDGGKKVRPTESQVKENLNGIKNFLLQNDSIDFFLLQEVDISAKRSYGINQKEAFAKEMRQPIYSYFALNYNVFFVPLPITEPMGYVQSGLNTITRFAPQLVERRSFPCNFSWPLRVFMLDRCFIVSYHQLTNQKQLVIINTHNSAFDGDGYLRKAELDYFRNFLIAEYQKGNYVIAGGDFNQSPPHLTTNFEGEPFDFDDYVSIPDSLLPDGWNYCFDNTTPSNRRVIDAYQKGKTKITLIDFFITSPNVTINSVKCINLGFEHSDHNPIIGTFTLKSNNDIKENDNEEF